MAGKEVAVDERLSQAEGVVLDLPDLFQNHLFFGRELGFADFQPKQDFLLDVQSEGEVLRREGDFEKSQILAGVGVEDRTMAAEVPGDLASGPQVRSPEQDVMLQEMGQARRLVRLVLGPGVNAGDDIHQGDRFSPDDKNAKAVVQGKNLLRGGEGLSRDGRSEDRGGQNQKEEVHNPVSRRGPSKRLSEDHCTATVHFIRYHSSWKATFMPGCVFPWICPKSAGLLAEFARFMQRDVTPV